MEEKVQSVSRSGIRDFFVFQARQSAAEQMEQRARVKIHIFIWRPEQKIGGAAWFFLGAVQKTAVIPVMKFQIAGRE